MEYARFQDIVALKKRCVAAGVSAPPTFWGAMIHELQDAYNGIGPDRWSNRFRATVTALLDPFEVAALPHDWEYSQPEKSYWLFTLANLRFLVNSWLEARQLYPDNRRSRWRMTACGAMLALLCQLFGYSGYKTGGR